MRQLIRPYALGLLGALWLTPALVHAEETDDVVMLTNGGRVRGVVIEQDPTLGVRIKLMDGTLRTFKPEEVREVRYHGEAPTDTTPLQHGGHKFELGMRLGTAIPMGKYHAGGTDGNGVNHFDAPLSDAVSFKVPILIEAGYELTQHFVLVLHWQYAFYSDKSTCSSGMSCSEHDMELGIGAQYHGGLGERVDPWVGLGVGYEFNSRSTSGREADINEAVSFDSTTQGPQYLKLQGGVDFGVADVMTVGPFLSFSLAEYTSSSDSASGATVNGDVPLPALHEWITLGVKGTFHLGGD